MTDKEYMEQALSLAAAAGESGEIPVGAIVTDIDGNIIAAGKNTSEREKSFGGHAEMNALEAACKYTGRTKLYGCTLYTTLEPCPMCMGACIISGIKRIVFGAYDPKNGSAVSAANINNCEFTHIPEIRGGILEDKCGALLRGFFGKIRKTKRSVDIIPADSEAGLKKICGIHLVAENEITADKSIFCGIIRKNGKPAGTVILKDGRADIRISKEYSAYVTESEVTDALKEGEYIN